MTLSEELIWRGFVGQTTFDRIHDIDQPRIFYFGVDPSASSMHVGHFAAIMLVKLLIKHGHTAIALVGGATGMIGDPKQDSERILKTLDEIALNKAGIAAQYNTLLEGEPFELVDNYDWFKDIGYLTFLRDIGKHFSMTQLLDREFVKARIGNGGTGISYAEFSYNLIQGYDFLHLFRNKGATLQIGGSDQWGNMLSGAQMIKKIENADAHVWTVPLLIDKTTGKKFGKSEGNAIWLDAEQTSPFQFYQFWLNADDSSVGDYIKIVTTVEPDAYDALMHDFTTDPAARSAQKYLAYETTKLVHGTERADQARRVTESLFGSMSCTDLTQADIDVLSKEIPLSHATTIITALTSSGLCESASEARRLIAGNAVSLNGEKISADCTIQTTSLIKKGKNSFVLVQPA